MNVELAKAKMTDIRDRAFVALRTASTELDIVDALRRCGTRSEPIPRVERV